MHHAVDGRSGGHGVGEDALPLGEDQVRGDAQRPAFVAFGDEGEEHLRLLGPLGQVAQIVEEQEVKVVQLAQLPGQVQVSVGCKQLLHQPVGGGEEDRVPRFHQAAPHSAQRMGLAGPGKPEGQEVDATLDEAPLGQLVQLLPERYGVNGTEKLGHWGGVTVYHRPDDCRSKWVKMATLQE